jgi:hypothetical protein
MKTTSQTHNQFKILDYSPIGQFVIDEDMEVLYWNQRMVEWTEVNKEKIIDLPAQVSDCLIPTALPNGKFRIQSSAVTRFNEPNSEGNLLFFSLQDVTNLTDALAETEKVTLQIGKEATLRKKAKSKLRENKKRLAQLANHDVLTKLPNRRLLSDRLQHAIIKSCRSDSKIAVLFLDLDRFKKINDTFGKPMPASEFTKFLQQKKQK